MSSRPFLPVSKPTIDEASIAAVGDVLRSGWIPSGPKVQAFEAQLSEYVGGRPVRTFNTKANEISNTVVLCISADLPFAQARFCGAEGLENVKNLSTLRGAEFIQNYGVAIADGPLKGLTARAVVVLDENDNVLHSELVNEIANEPDYEAALAVLK